MRYRPVYALILGLTLLSPAREATGEGILEHVLTEQRGPDLYGEVTPSDTTVPTEFDSGVALSVSVPRSPGWTDALFFDVSAQSLYKFTADPERRIRVSVMIRLVSDALPPYISVTRGAALANDEATNRAGDEDLGFRRSRRDVKFVLWRSRLSDFVFMNETTGEALSEAEAIAVQRRLMNNGFTAELSTAGTIQGVSEHFGLGLAIEVTRALRLLR